jgi:hypothetical protein
MARPFDVFSVVHEQAKLIKDKVASKTRMVDRLSIGTILSF